MHHVMRRFKPPAVALLLVALLGRRARAQCGRASCPPAPSHSTVHIWHVEQGTLSNRPTLAFMYHPAIATLRRGLEAFANASDGRWRVAARAIRVGVDPAEQRTILFRRFNNQCEVFARDVFVWIGAGHEDVPWACLRARGAHAVLYQTEPHGDACVRTDVDELWDYSHFNLKACARANASAAPRARYVPPGFHGGYPFVAADRPIAALTFFGSPKQGRRRQCWQLLKSQVGAALRSVYNVWSEDAFVAFLRAANDTAFTHLHKSCDEVLEGGAAWRPLPAFRDAALLNAGRLVISERCDEDDEREFAGLVDFFELRDIAREYRRVTRVPVSELRTLLLARYEDFVRRFDPELLFRRAGIYELLDELWARRAEDAKASPLPPPEPARDRIR